MNFIELQHVILPFAHQIRQTKILFPFITVTENQDISESVFSSFNFSFSIHISVKYLQNIFLTCEMIWKKSNFKATICVNNTNRVCHVWGNFYPGYMCWTTTIFGIMKDGSPEINSLALNNCFSYRNVFQNGVNALSKMVFKIFFFFVFLFLFCFVLFFCQKAQNFV